jgi:glyceraldehyde 3-phosphate dehydrogenase
VDIVIESTGRFRTGDTAVAHLSAGVSKVLLSSSGKGVDAIIVLGVDDQADEPRPTFTSAQRLAHHQTGRHRW